jgi:hypothetical protein
MTVALQVPTFLTSCHVAGFALLSLLYDFQVATVKFDTLSLALTPQEIQTLSAAHPLLDH